MLTVYGQFRASTSTLLTPYGSHPVRATPAQRGLA